MDSKPFHTKILSAGIHISFTDDIDVSMLESTGTIIHSNFNLHTDHCYQPPDCCEIQGLETFVLDDDRGLEYINTYSIVSDPLGLVIDSTTGQTRRPISWLIGPNSSGVPTFYDFPNCTIEPTVNGLDPACDIGFEVHPYETEGYEFADPECEVYCKPSPACELGLEENILELNLLESSVVECEEVCGFQPSGRLGLELSEIEQYAIEYADPIPVEIWANNYHGPCTSAAVPCSDVSHTTVSARIYETLTIIEDGVTVLLDV